MKTRAQLDREIAQALSRPRGATRSRSHATRRKLPDRYEVVETIDGDWMILIDGVQTGSKRDRSGAGSDTYPTYEAAHEAAIDLAYPSVARRSHATTKKGAAPQASAGFAIHTDHEDVIKDNASDRFGTDYGDAADRNRAVKAGLVDARGKITDRGWEQLNKDIRVLENNALTWLRKTFGHASDQGHGSDGDLIGSVSFDPRSVKQARNIYYGAREGRQERIDFTDTGHGDFAGSGGAWKGVSSFGQDLLGGHITFFDIQPPEAIEVAEAAVDRAATKKSRAHRR
ncbi:MAG TPA: hypothetical protein VLE97_11665 [Gaiellaceae bacterium]|nr:hypothetical protein [Gaiellaceae bacterium]